VQRPFVFFFKLTGWTIFLFFFLSWWDGQYFLPKTLRNYSMYFVKPIYSLKIQKKHLKTWNKNLLEFIFVFLGTSNERKKTFTLNSSHCMKSLDNKSTVLMVRIVINDNFFSLRRNSASLSFSPQQKSGWKIRKIKFDIKIDFLKNDHLRVKKNERQK
jgi:hypothetical protein